MTRRILVTGANGRLGRALWRVDAGAHPLVGWGGRRADSIFPAVDVTDAAAVGRALADTRPRVVIHLASTIGADCEWNPTRATAVNEEGTANLLAAAVECGVVRFVFASTAAVYGTAGRHPLSETDELAPVGVYATTKLRAEAMLEAAADRIAVDVMRVFNVYGPGMDDSLVNRLARSTAAAPAMLSGLDGFVRDYVHVDDVARALLAAADSSGTGFRVFNVGSGVPRSNRALLDALPGPVRATVDIGPEVDSYSAADIGAISRALSWTPLEPWPPF